MGAPSRRGEVIGVKSSLEQLKSLHILNEIVSMEAPATLDGGDVLTMEKEILVGLSKRTNQGGVEWLTKVRTAPP
jgi:dimethylargininase